MDNARRELIGFYLFETNGSVARAINKFTLLENSDLTDVLFNTNIKGDFTLVETILKGVGAYLDIGVINSIEYDKTQQAIKSGSHGYYIENIEMFIFIEMMEKRRAIFDIIMQVYNVTLRGMKWI